MADMKRRVSAETQTELVRYIHEHWPSKFRTFNEVLSSDMEILKPTSKVTFDYRGKDCPFIRVRRRERKFVLECLGDKKVRLAVVSLNDVFGLRIARKPASRWNEVLSPDAMLFLAKHFVNQFPHNMIGGSEHYFDVMENINTEVTMSLIRYRVVKLSGKSLQDSPCTSIPRWLITQGIKSNTTYISCLNDMIARLLENERPTANGVVFVTGTDILQAYCRHDGARSCMTGPNNTSKIELYALNPDQCMLALIYSNKNCTGRPVARCLVWKQKEGDKEIWYPDRTYPPHVSSTEKAHVAIENYLKDHRNNKIELRWFRETGWVNPEDDRWDEDMDEDQHERQRDDYRARKGGEGASPPYSPVLILDLPESMSIPYMDTFIWGQVLSDGKGMFARAPSRMFRGIEVPKYKKKLLKHTCPVTLPEGVTADSIPEMLSSTEGGRWQPKWATCSGCHTDYNTNPASRFGGNSLYIQGHWSIGLCTACFDKQHVITYAPTDNQGRITRVSTPSLKADCVWSKNLNAWVDPSSSIAKHYLKYDDGEKDWYTIEDPRWKEKVAAAPGTDSTDIYGNNPIPTVHPPNTTPPITPTDYAVHWQAIVHEAQNEMEGEV